MTQAPHWLVSQPTCVPVRPRFSRRDCTNSVRFSAFAVCFLPLTVMVTDGIALLPQWACAFPGKAVPGIGLGLSFVRSGGAVKRSARDGSGPSAEAGEDI